MTKAAGKSPDTLLELTIFSRGGVLPVQGQLPAKQNQLKTAERGVLKVRQNIFGLFKFADGRNLVLAFGLLHQSHTRYQTANPGIWLS